MRRENESLRLSLEKLKKKHDDQATLVFELRNRITNLEVTNSRLIKKLEKTQMEMKQTLSIFTPGQQRRIMNAGLHHVNWAEEDKAWALGLYVVSPKAYDYVRTVWKYPLPCKSTIHSTLQKMEIKPDQIIQPVMNILRRRRRYFEAVCHSSRRNCHRS